MRMELRIASIAAALAVGCSCFAFQAARQSLSISGATCPGPGFPGEHVIADPHTGRRWLLARDPEHPGGPGKLVEAPVGEAAKSNACHIVIRTGDCVLLEEMTPVARGVFETVALSSARQGASLRVRLRIGGRVVRAIAIGPRRAIVVAGDEVRR